MKKAQDRIMCLLNNLTADLRHMLVICPDHVVLKSLGDRIESIKSTMEADGEHRTFNQLCDVQFELHDLVNTKVTIPELNIQKTFQSSTVFSKIGRMAEPTYLSESHILFQLTIEELSSLFGGMKIQRIKDVPVYDVELSIERR